jgi:hypothetical protein
LPRSADVKRERRAAARAARQAKPNGSSGRDSPEITPAQTLWQHAEKLQPKAPWRAIVREFGINEAVALDAHRTHKLPSSVYITTCLRLATAAVRAADEGAGLDPVV